MAESRKNLFNDDEVVFFGGEIKALGEGKIGGVLIRRTNETQPDLTGDFFSQKTDIRFHPEEDVYYNHGLDKTLKKRVIGRAKITTMDNGDVWAETQLNMRDEYEKAIYSMAESGKLGYSSGALSHLVEREPAGKGIWMIKTWAVGEVSLTPTPAEPRNTVIALKSLLTSQAALPDKEDENKNTNGDTQKMNDEIKAAVDAALAERDAKVQAEATKAAELKAAQEAGYKAAVEELDKKGMLVKAPAYVKNLGSDSDDGVGAFKNWLQTGQHNSELIQPSQENGFASNTKAAFNVTTGASGSYLVPDPLYQTIIAKRTLMSWARQAPVQTFSTPADHILVPVEDTSATAFVLTAEAAAYDENEPTVAQKDIILYKYTKLVKMSEEFVNYQGTNFDQWIASVFARAEAVTENTIFTTGTGSGQPQGLNTTAISTGNTVTTSAVLVPQDLTTLIGKLGAGYNVAGQTGFLMQNATNWYLRGVSSTNYFAFINTPAPGVATSYNEGFLGKPAYISDDMDAYTVASSSGHSVIYGNFNYFGIAEKPGLLIQRNPYLYMANGQIGLFATMYRGSAVLQGEAFYRTVGK